MASGNQLHDFNPGINPFPNGLFWFVELSPSNLQVNLDAGTAQLKVENLAIEDYTNLTNSLTSDPPPIPEIAATTTFDVRWSGVITRVQRNNPTEGFAGAFAETNSTILWSARQIEAPFFSFVSDRPSVSPQTTVFAEIGQENNGIFYRPS